MLIDPSRALHLARERQAKLLREAESDRLAGEYLRERTTPLLLRLSNFLILSGLWLRARAERRPSAAAVAIGRWHAMPLMMLRFASDQTTAASLPWWPMYSLGMRSIASVSGYAIVPAAWLPSATMPRDIVTRQP
jgi:hypothetical protein